MKSKILFISLILLGFVSLKYLRIRKDYVIESKRNLELKQELDSLTIKLDVICGKQKLE